MTYLKHLLQRFAHLPGLRLRSFICFRKASPVLEYTNHTLPFNYLGSPGNLGRILVTISRGYPRLLIQIVKKSTGQRVPSTGRFRYLYLQLIRSKFDPLLTVDELWRCTSIFLHPCSDFIVAKMNGGIILHNAWLVC